MIDGIVIAGGAGSRFGRPKAAELLGGLTLVERAVGLLASRCARVIVVTRPTVPIPAVDASVVTDRPGPDAPIVGLATGLERSSADACLVLACDLPFAGPLVDRLLAVDPARAAVAVDSAGQIQPLCARYPRARVLELANWQIANGQLALRALVERLDALTVTGSDDELLNINTPDDLARAEALIEPISRG